MKAIQKELGKEDHSTETEQIRASIKKLGLPKEALEKIKLIVLEKIKKEKNVEDIDIYKIIKKGQKKKLKVKVVYNGPIEAPIKRPNATVMIQIIGCPKPRNSGRIHTCKIAIDIAEKPKIDPTERSI